MKKTFAILLSLVLIVTAVFALALSSSAADAPKVASVTITDAEGGTHVLDAATTSYSAKTGTATFNAATGELTLDGVSGVKKIYSKNGALTIVVKGENTLESDGTFVIHADTEYIGSVCNPDYPSNLVFKGDGVLNVKGKNYIIVSQSGILEFTDKVKVNTEATATSGYADTLHISSQGTDMIFSGDSVVSSVSHAMVAIRNNGSGKMYVQDNATLNSTVTEAPADWTTGITTKSLKMTGGTINVDVTGRDAATPTTLSGIAVNGVNEILGGTVNVTVSSKNKTASRLHAFYMDNGQSLTIDGATLNLKVDTPLAGSKISGVITTEETSSYTIKNSTINVDAPNTTALFTPRNIAVAGDAATLSVNISGSTITGFVKSFFGTNSIATSTTVGVGKIAITSAKDNFYNLGCSSGVILSDCKDIVTVKNETSLLTKSDFTNDSLGLISGHPISSLITVTVTPPQGVNFTLNAGKRTLTAAEAERMGVAQDSIVYDPLTATVTFNNMNGSVNRVYANGPVTYVVKGENTITMLPNSTDAALGAAGKMIVTGDGSITVSGGNYTLMSPGEMIMEGKVKVKVISHSTNAIHVSRTSAPGACALIVRGDAQLDILAKNRGIYNPGAKPMVQITDNAKVTIAPVGETMTQGIYLLADVDDGTGSQDAVVEVSGNASLKIDKAASVGILYQYTAKDDDNKTSIAEETAVNAILNITDNANVDVASREQTVFFNINRDGNSAVLNISDTANVKLASIDPTNETAKGAAVQMSSPKNVVTMTTTGTVDMSANAGGWRGAFYMTGKDYDVVIKDTVLNVSNVANSTTKTNPEVTNAINFDCTGTGNITLAGKAVVTAYAEKNGENSNNRAHGLFLQPNHVLTIQDDATFNTTAAGDSKADTGAGIHLKESSIVVKDNGKMNVLAKGTAVAGITFEGKSALTVEGNAKVTITADGENVVGVRTYNRTTDATIEVKEGTGYVELIGDPAVSTKNRKITINSAIMKTGDTKKDAEAVEKITGNEGYVLLAAKNPPTSDISIAVFAIVGLVAVAATAAVILRKKYND